jgi:hypothetical protein
MIKELSHFNQTKSTSMICMQRYYMEDNQIKDELSTENPMNIILEKGAKDEWTFIDNDELLKYCYTEKIKVNPEIKKELERYDLTLIPPIINKMSNNSKE